MDNGITGDLIVTDGVEKVTRFKEIIEDDSIKKIAVGISGGTDSPLILYFMAKFISISKSYDKEIYPHFYLDTGIIVQEREKLIPKQIDIVRELFPDVTIHDLFVQEFFRAEDWDDNAERYVAHNSGKYIDKLEKNMLNTIQPDLLLTGSTRNLPTNLLKLYGHEVDMSGNIINAGKQLDIDEVPQLKRDRSPWYDVDKKFIAHQYKKEGLMKNLYPITESCICESMGEVYETGGTDFPCKLCHQCIEKYIAFGMYDRCVTK